MNNPMKQFLKITVFAAVLGTVGAVSAQAEVNVWRDPVSKMYATYNDQWLQVNNQNPGDVITLWAPSKNAGAQDLAECKVNIRNDGRFQIYPVRYSGEIQRLNFSRGYWDQYLARYDNVLIHKGLDNEGLGSGFASMVSASYDTVTGERARKRGVGFVSYYQGKVYTAECSSRESAYMEWHDAFMNFIQSISFDEHTNFAYSGYYRDFIVDRTLKVRGPTILEDHYLGIHAR